MQETTVKQLLKTTNTVLIMIMLLFGLNLTADLLGWKSQGLVIKNHTYVHESGKKFVYPLYTQEHDFGTQMDIMAEVGADY